MVGIGVVGAGVIGLTSAVSIKNAFPDVPVTIVADKFYEKTTSYGAGGSFRPSLNQIGGDKETITRWITDSWHFFDGLAKSPQAKETGLAYVPGFVVYNTPQDDAYAAVKDLVYDYHVMTPKEMQRRNLNYKYGYAFTSIVTQPPIFLKWLMKEFRSRGGKFQERKVKKLEDLHDEFDVVINCCGLGSKDLVGEQRSYPVKGQIVWLKAPWIHHYFLSEDDVYFIPHFDKLVVGGTREKGNDSTNVDPLVTERIISKAESLFPQLKGAEVLGTWAGVRPFCDPVRLESEYLSCGPKGHLPVIHNYGHGGHGVTLSWGCSLHVVRLLKDILKRPKSSL